jgi:hypothetical protein
MYCEKELQDTALRQNVEEEGSLLMLGAQRDVD